MIDNLAAERDKSIAVSQGVSADDFFVCNRPHQTELTIIPRPDGSFTLCSDSYWHGEHQQGIAFDMTKEQALAMAKWLNQRI